MSKLPKLGGKNMKLKKIGAVLAGAALLGATLAGAAAQDVPPTEFFIDPETGQPNVVIVVGSGAAAMDVVSATMLAAKIGTMTYTETEEEVIFIETFIVVHEDINPIFLIHNTGNWINVPENLLFGVLDIQL
jgi:S-layer protein (TIGR01564 family)